MYTGGRRPERAQRHDEGGGREEPRECTSVTINDDVHTITVRCINTIRKMMIRSYGVPLIIP